MEDAKSLKETDKKSKTLQYSAKTYKVCGVMIKVLAIVVMIILELAAFYRTSLLGMVVAFLIAFRCWDLGNASIEIAESMTEQEQEIHEIGD